MEFYAFKWTILTVILAACFCMECTAELYDWIEAPYGNDDFNKDVKFGDDASLTCYDSRLSNVNYTAEYWILPDLYVMKPGDVRSFMTLDGMASWNVSFDAMDIKVTLVQLEQFGFYYCVVLLTDENNEPMVVKKAINYGGPYFGSIWDNYETNFITGISASAGFLTASVIAYVIYRFKFAHDDDPANDDDDDTSSKTRPKSNQSKSSRINRNNKIHAASNSGIASQDDGYPSHYQNYLGEEEVGKSAEMGDHYEVFEESRKLASAGSVKKRSSADSSKF